MSAAPDNDPRPNAAVLTATVAGSTPTASWSLDAPAAEVAAGVRQSWLNTFHCGDAIELMDQMPAKSVGLVVTSPPYNLRNSSGGGMRYQSSGFWSKLLHGYDGYDDALPEDKYIAWQRRCLSAMQRVLTDDGAIFYNFKWRVQGGALQDRREIIKDFEGPYDSTDGCRLRQIIIWARAGGFNHNIGYFLPTYEVIYLICKRGFSLASNDPKHPNDMR